MVLRGWRGSWERRSRKRRGASEFRKGGFVVVGFLRNRIFLKGLGFWSFGVGYLVF